MSTKRSNNQLTASEMFMLTKQVEAALNEGLRLNSLREAEVLFSKRVGRTVTRHNIDTAIKTCGKTVYDILDQNSDTTPTGRIMSIVRKLEARVEALEVALK